MILPLRTHGDDGLSVLRLIYHRLTEFLCSIASNAVNTVRAVQSLYDPFSSSGAASKEKVVSRRQTSGRAY